MNARSLDESDDTSVIRPGFSQAGGDVQLISRQEGFSGAISLPLLPDLIQIYTISLANGALTIRRGAERGTIWFEHGEMVHAECGEQIGEEAVYRLLQWQKGHFSLDPDARASTRSITVSWQNVLMEGCRRLDESGRSAQAPTKIDEAFAELDKQLTGFLAVALFDVDGELVAQTSRAGDIDLGQAGPLLIEMLRRQARVMEELSRPLPLRDCFWILGDQVHLIEPLSNGLLLQLLLDRSDVNLALTRRAVDRVMGLLA
jgi:hypothetical protein